MYRFESREEEKRSKIERKKKDKIIKYHNTSETPTDVVVI